MNTTQRGSVGERLAANYLAEQGYILLERNFRCRYGEIDVIACQREMVVFVEVKLRKNAGFSRAAEAVTPAKRERLRKAASLWLAQQDCGAPARFDVVEVYVQSGELVHLENAFE